MRVVVQPGVGALDRQAGKGIDTSGPPTRAQWARLTDQRCGPGARYGIATDRAGEAPTSFVAVMLKDFTRCTRSWPELPFDRIKGIAIQCPSIRTPDRIRINSVAPSP